MAGILGLDPGPFTLRELLWMVEARQIDHWNHTAAVLAMLANTHRDPQRSRLFRPADFHPHAPRSVGHETLPQADISILKTVFVDRRPLGN